MSSVSTSSPQSLELQRARISAAQARELRWDCIVIGSGLGGTSAAWALAQKNLKVLILEKGPWPGESDELPLWKEPVHDVRSRISCLPFLGEGLGGSSRLYGMVMERLEGTDFEAEGGSWPGSLDEWLPRFKQAEALLSVRPAPQRADFDPLFARLDSLGHKPKALQLSFRNKPRCDFCQSGLCPSECKVDAVTGPLQEASQTGRIHVAPAVEAVSLRQEAGCVKAVRVRSGDESFDLAADRFVLAAGALRTPLILSRSQSVSGGASFCELPSIGRYLMRHLIDLYILHWAQMKKLSPEQRQELARAKTWGLDSLYRRGDLKLGTIQAFGSLPRFDEMWIELKALELRRFHALPGVKSIAREVVRRMASKPIAASILEDSACPENRVFEGSGGEIRMDYSLSREDRAKIALMRQECRTLFGPFLHKVQAQAENNFRLAHVCGTARMGNDPEVSVTDFFGKVRRSENLWIADSSVFPSSTGKNPGLTIVAHALRAAADILKS